MKILVTGAAGFIGYHVSQRLLEQGHEVVGADNLNDYYDVNLKQARLDLLLPHPQFQFFKMNLSEKAAVSELFAAQKFERVIHLAAQPGVRYSIQNPMAYIDANILGHMNILEGCRHNSVGHLIYSSSSSVYGLNRKQPFSVEDDVDHPVSLYAATKKANELMSHSYSHLYQLPTTGLRFFTVYGPWGRPDMALFKFVKAMLDGKPIDVYNHGNMVRDFTYVGDIAEAVVRLVDVIPAVNNDWTVEEGLKSASSAPYKIYNVGNGQPTRLGDFIQAIETALDIKANKHYMDMQDGDVLSTCADSSELYKTIGFSPDTPVNYGVQQFVDWYMSFYHGKK
ncbi:TPA: NAD-dependent epimerase [Morganella morganii subsp. morganii]|uniref:NAD-dependent epimerase n=1 Tax=Morganella morganii TaxID=582 RepID=A0AAU8ZQ45_MORMO|nr:NAD-dependent epimerase [Morganella morganii]HDS6884334.1 NAD-dependent epimerase [Morganella morganii subsp. morganii]AVK38309.1 3-beta hydroxysteroid dehydrogenase/isomerase family protein [Morganella morganii]AWC95059.1 NAD-dependent epimerase [Morganella morganii]EKW8484424.1 NAD-dependent epimerase [Morganella morganii]ELO7536764.1 NAD-dependent epimerase [Morganella morganii]